jgi:Phosphorylase superfamily
MTSAAMSAAGRRPVVPWGFPCEGNGSDAIPEHARQVPVREQLYARGLPRHSARAGLGAGAGTRQCRLHVRTAGALRVDATRSLHGQRHARYRARALFPGQRLRWTVGTNCLGIGAPAAVAQLELQADLGVRRCISIGTAGGLQASDEPGQVVLVSHAVRDHRPSLRRCQASSALQRNGAVPDGRVTAKVMACALARTTSTTARRPPDRCPAATARPRPRRAR